MNYLEFYGLQREPFHVTPDPNFLYLSPSHREALAAIIHGIKRRKGIITVFGEVGLGKTTVLRSYLESEHAANTKVVYIFNSNITFRDLLHIVYEHLGIEIRSNSMFELVDTLSVALIEEFKRGIDVVVIVDEAQNMPVKTLEHLRMLSNLETTRDKLIQIVLIGQPELEDKLNRHELRQLRQRIAVSTRLHPLTEQESRDYIHHRLEKAYAVEPDVFSKRAMNLLVKQASGAPRTINIIADNALITGFGYGKKPVSIGVVREVIADLTGERKRRIPAVLWPSLLFSTLFLGVVLWAMNGAFENKFAVPPAGPAAGVTSAWKQELDQQQKTSALRAQLEVNNQNQLDLSKELEGLEKTARMQDQQRKELEERLQQQKTEQQQLREKLGEEESVRSQLQQRLAQLKLQQESTRDQSNKQSTQANKTFRQPSAPPRPTVSASTLVAMPGPGPEDVTRPEPAYDETEKQAAYSPRQVTGEENTQPIWTGQIPQGQLSFQIARPDSPRIVKYAIPSYPRNERKNWIEGTVILSVLVTGEGDPGIVRIVQGITPELDEAAVEAVRQWRFEPATRNNLPTTSWGRYAITFQLNR